MRAARRYVVVVVVPATLFCYFFSLRILLFPRNCHSLFGTADSRGPFSTRVGRTVIYPSSSVERDVPDAIESIPKRIASGSVSTIHRVNTASTAVVRVKCKFVKRSKINQPTRNNTPGIKPTYRRRCAFVYTKSLLNDLQTEFFVIVTLLPLIHIRPHLRRVKCVLFVFRTLPQV